jgi:fatty acid desaturase
MDGIKSAKLECGADEMRRQREESEARTARVLTRVAVVACLALVAWAAVLGGSTVGWVRALVAAGAVVALWCVVSEREP